MRYAAVLGLVAACGGGGGTSADGPSIDRGPDNIPIDGDPNGAYWDPVGKTLYLADQQGNQILTWTDAAGFGTAIPLTDAPADDTKARQPPCRDGRLARCSHRGSASARPAA